MYYDKELKALKRSGRYRTRELYNEELLDFASNDYLGLAHNKELHALTSQELSTHDIHAPKASMLVNGYHKIHQDFEQELCRANGFEDGVVLGSGFNANIALIESMVRKGDLLIMDEKYHASGVLASQIGAMDVALFRHNDMTHLDELLQKHAHTKRKIVAVEGIYSMDGDLVPAEVFGICEKHDALLIVDEAHSSGVVGNNLMGVYDLYNIKIAPNHIKMGTLGKAYGSFGAYILASSHIIEYLLNRAKPIIYATSLSLYDTLLAHNSLRYIQSHKAQIKAQIAINQAIIHEELGIQTQSLIIPIVVADNKKVMQIKEKLLAKGYSIGAIRQPTVEKAIIRLIARLGESEVSLRQLCQEIKRELDSEL
ncbi:MAG: aminotransferase class I/II-fold pyridoxal phosphate-dependent enzyme [Sulfurimonas sp.]|jgi:8-amino-7-oxononanoate synthase|nr:aminotransferase class I/II-fold pyridoxal phosphate-dependent enzyme [Sulfurimonas sp.]